MQTTNKEETEEREEEQRYKFNTKMLGHELTVSNNVLILIQKCLATVRSRPSPEAIANCRPRIHFSKNVIILIQKCLAMDSGQTSPASMQATLLQTRQKHGCRNPQAIVPAILRMQL